MPGLEPSERERVEALKTLGLPRRARADEVRVAYVELARKLHPDVNPDGAERFRQVAAAYELLRRYHRHYVKPIDPAKREKPAAFDERWWTAFGERV